MADKIQKLCDCDWKAYAKHLENRLSSLNTGLHVLKRALLKHAVCLEESSPDVFSILATVLSVSADEEEFEAALAIASKGSPDQQEFVADLRDLRNRLQNTG